MNDREASKNPHPPACTCVDCTQRRLQRQKGFFQRIVDFIRGRR